MTFVPDQIKRLDAQLDGLQILQLDYVPASEPSSPVSAESSSSHVVLRGHRFQPSEHAQNLKKIIRQLGRPTSRTQTPQRLLWYLAQAKITGDYRAHDHHSQYERELEWLLLSKAAIQIYGIVLNSLVDQTLPLSEDLYYWDEVLSSSQQTTLYLLQTGPQRLVHFCKDIYGESIRRLEELRANGKSAALSSNEQKPQGSHPVEPTVSGATRQAPKESLSESARKFYGLVRTSLSERAYIYRLSAISPFSLARNEIRQKKANIRKLREMQAAALGMLIGEGLSFEFDEGNDEWHVIVGRAILLMENVLRNVWMVDRSLEDFEETVFTFHHSHKGEDSSDRDEVQALQEPAYGRTPVALSKQLQGILTHHLPMQGNASKRLIGSHGRPGALTRYWVPATALLLSSATILRVLVNRRESLRVWLREFGETVLDFWSNWVIEPTKKIIGTIRHSEDSEVALMSRKSLSADLESLQRMVVDFAADTSYSSSGPLLEAELAAIQQNVKEGDLTPVLRAYEHDLRSPFKGVVRGELVRALLIQIQKTKVDVEVAISGIDRLLKSQELVFGFVGLTPGIIVSAVTIRWISGMFRRKDPSVKKKKRHMVRRLHNVDKLLTASVGLRGGNGGCLDYKEHGLLLCEVHVLRQYARSVLRQDVFGEFAADLEELANARIGVQRQLRVVDRIRWTYSKAF